MFKCDKCKGKFKQVWAVNGKWLCKNCSKTEACFNLAEAMYWHGSRKCQRCGGKFVRDILTDKLSKRSLILCDECLRVNSDQTNG